MATLVAIPFSIFLPAVGTFGYFHINESEPYLKIIEGMHDGTLKTLDFHNMQGVVTFPSFHAAAAILIAYAARGIRLLFPVLLVLNAVMIIATPPIGGHYFIDIWGGIVQALATILIVRKYCTPVMSPIRVAAT